MNQNSYNWLSSASADIESMEHLVKNNNHRSACSLGCIAVEKILKGYMSFLGIEVKPSHNSSRMFRECVAIDSTISGFKYLSDISKKLYQERYPDTGSKYTDEYADQDKLLIYYGQVKSFYDEVCYRVGY